MAAKLPSPDEIPHQFDKLTKAVIDTSSILYLNKSGILDQLKSVLKLITIPEVIEECGKSISSNEMEVVVFRGRALDSTDDRLLAGAARLQVPVISEDRKLILKTLENDLQCYNSAMMVNYLFYKDFLSKRQSEKIRRKLKKVARYGKDIWTYEDSVFEVILQKKNGK